MGVTLRYVRRATREVSFGGVTIGGTRPIAVQSMANTPTADIEQTVAQTLRIANAAIVALKVTAQRTLPK